MNGLAFIVGDRVLPFPSESFLLGSGEGCALRFSQLEAKHAEVFLEDEAWLIRDISGTSTMRVNGALTLEAKIDDGSHVKIGALKLTVRGGAAAGGGGEGEDRTLIPTGGGVLANGLIIDGRYQVLGKIAAGGMGAVYLVEHLELGRKFAMKVMLLELSRDPEFVARFKKEAVASSRIGHQNIVAISDFGRTGDGRFYFVMEYLEGETLSEVMRSEGALPAERVVGIALQLARALATAHATGIIHRDLKPENIMLIQQPGRPDFVKVLDFGVAKVAAAPGAEGKTAIGMVIGTPQYMSPEQASGLSVDARADVYALGLILYELFTGRPVFKAETPSMMIAMQITAKAPPFAPGPMEEAPELEALVLAMLEKRPSERPASMDAVLARLESIPLGGAPQGPAVTQLAPAAEEAPITLAAPVTLAAPITLAAPRTLAEPVAAQTALQPASRTEVSHRVAATAIQLRTEPAGPSTEELAIPRRSRWPLVFGLAIVLGGGGGYVVMALRPDPPVVPDRPVAVAPVEQVHAPSVEASTVAVNFETDPSGAEVLDGDVLLGVTPLTLKREKGTAVELRFVLKDYLPQTRKLRFEATTGVKIELDRRQGSGPGPASPKEQQPKEQPKRAPPKQQPKQQPKDQPKDKPKQRPKEKPKQQSKEKPAASELKDLPF